MLAGIISDTHDNLIGLQKGIKVFKDNDVKMIVHCGDWVSPYALEFFDKEIEGLDVPIKSVVGNNPGDIKCILLANGKMKHPIDWPP